ncbi:MAG: tRNA (adenosine(37)-N6)-threonylcarbamoyltransferase complex dimerization subunit type 1 TsaB [Gemmatimonadaceae bacterium]
MSSARRWSQRPVLVLEASTPNASVALLVDGTVRGTRELRMGASREDALFPAVVQLLAEGGVAVADLGAVVCGSGPGSFTSLRIAGAMAKGLVQDSSRSLVAVPSLLLAAAAHGIPGAWLMHADALRGDRYVLPVTIDAEGQVRTDAHTRIVPATDLTTTFPGMEAVSVRPEAAGLVRVAGWTELPPCDVDGWEPSYGRLAEAQVQWEATHARPLPPA